MKKKVLKEKNTEKKKEGVCRSYEESKRNFLKGKGRKRRYKNKY
jgi:hypothetical protein